MSLVTRCPSCATAFRVQRGQLAARAGQVRCGKCNTVFDGIAALMEDGPEPLRPEPSPQMGLFDPSRRGGSPSGAGKAGAQPLPAFMAERPATTAHAAWLWGMLGLAAAAVLAAQAAHRYRAEIAVQYPPARPALEAGCRLLGCEIPLPRRAELLSIESSDLQADLRREGVIQLNALIRNRAPFAQAYPALELTLTEDGGAPVVRRVLEPRDYLGTERAPALAVQGIPGGGEAALRVHLDGGATRASGYRLYLFYPQDAK
jgi:predicted Zn finger-like uncharacterized protein